MARHVRNKNEVTTEYYDGNEDTTDANDEMDKIRWQNIIFLPFNPFFKLIVICSVIIKVILGPLQSVHPVVHCSEVMDNNIYLYYIKLLYVRFCDIIYGIDVFLNILHMHVTDVAISREFLPKSALCIFLDIIALIPLYRLYTMDFCVPAHMWPNVLGFTEFVAVYRIGEYFQLITTHNIGNLVVGFFLLSVATMNFITWFYVLAREKSYNKCDNCTHQLYDWRFKVLDKGNDSESMYSSFFFSGSFVLSYLLPGLFDETDTFTVLEYIFACVLMILGYLVMTFVYFPKAFGESMLRLRRICELFPQMNMIIEETKRKNANAQAHKDVRKFYNLMWKKRGGITQIPEVITELPRYIRIDIRMDIVWPVFYHSPTFRRTSAAFQRWLCDKGHLDFKLPKENFFADPHSRTNFIYLKSGIVQFVSVEDGITPLISVTSGTIFGDVNFFLPPCSKKVIVRCLTYCEVFYFTRSEILTALHNFPEDRRNVMSRVHQRIKHARTLYACKQNVKGLDRSEDEGVAWIKKRWWEIHAAITTWKLKTVKGDVSCELPPEDTSYHCSKYIGRLVLCPEAHLKRQSMFASYTFPWILLPNSTLSKVWNHIVKLTVFLVLILHPPNIARDVKPTYFKYFQTWADLVYIADVCVLLMTSIETQGNLISDFASVMLKRFKNKYFVLTFISTIWIEDIVLAIGLPHLYSICKFNRLIKVIAIFFYQDTSISMNTDPFIRVGYRVIVVKIFTDYVIGYILYTISKIIPDNITTSYFFGKITSSGSNPEKQRSDPLLYFFDIAIAWKFRFMYTNNLPNTTTDIVVAIIVHLIVFMIHLYCTANLMAVIYLKNKDITDYLSFVNNITKHYLKHNIHPDLLLRLNRYLFCHWKFYKGAMLVIPHQVKDEPYDVYWKGHGEVAMDILKRSKAFVGVEPVFLKELTFYCKFTILPKNSTLLLRGHLSKHVSWLVNGVIKYEYYHETELVFKKVDTPGKLLAFNSVFYAKESQITALAMTDCELLYIGKKEFYKLLRRYPAELKFIGNCARKFEKAFEDINFVYHKKHVLSEDKAVKMETKSVNPHVNWQNPKSKFVMYWSTLRVVFVVFSITASSLQGGVGASYRSKLMHVSLLCDFFGLCDMFLNCFIGYYDEKGIVIYSKMKCLKRYLTHGFILDVIAVFPLVEGLKYIPKYRILDDTALCLTTITKYARIHLLIGYFNYLADSPVGFRTIILLAQWQLFMILLMFCMSQYLIYLCVRFEWDDKMTLIKITKHDTCWIQKHSNTIDESPTQAQMHLLFGESVNLAQLALMSAHFGFYKISRSDLILEIILCTCSFIYWWIYCYAMALIVLSSRGTTLFQHAVNSLSAFLYAERLDKEVIKRSIDHFNYWWKRTQTINTQNNLFKRIGVIFRRDLNYFFFKETFVCLDSILKGGEAMQRQLACMPIQMYFLPGWTIMREMDLTPWVYVVHRGKVTITQDGVTLAVLSKGSIFGQLIGTETRPTRVSAHTVDHVDVLQITVNGFQDNISDVARENILNNPESENDYMQAKKKFKENPYNTVTWLMRGTKTLQLPWMKEPVEVHKDVWYTRWLFAVCMVEPFVSSFTVFLLGTLPLDMIYMMLWILIPLDLIHLAHFLSEFYTMQLAVVGQRYVKRHKKLRKLKELWTYLDVLSIALPAITIFNGNWKYQIARMLRLKLFLDVDRHFCKDFQSPFIRGLLNMAIIYLIIHFVTCGWVAIGCRPHSLDESYYKPQLATSGVDVYHLQEWVSPEVRGEGCRRLSKIWDTSNRSHVHYPQYLVPKRWQDDYVLAVTFVILHIVKSDLNTIAEFTVEQLIYKIIMAFIMNLLNIWVVSLALNLLYLKFRELINYDYNVRNLIEYLRHLGLNDSLLDCVKEYANLLWQRQKGTWLPELAHQAPVCLREDLLSTLYSHHMENVPLLKNLPDYFKRQLAARLCRVVVFPGRAVVEAGDVFSCIYFIHEGEVEKWCTDSAGETKMLSLLTTNGYFGLIPGLFTDAPYQFSYITRTVVDMVYLRLGNWQDLLEGFPDIKHDLYTAARRLKQDLGKP